MSTITLQNIRVSSDLTVGVRLKDSGVAIDWSTLSNIKAYIYADAQRAMAGRCAVSIDAEDSTRLVCSYRANKPQYIGVNRIVITCTYRGETKTYDKPALNFVRWTDDQAGQQITIDDPDIEVEIDVEDVSSTILENAIAAAIQAAADAEHAAHLIPNQVLLDCEEATTEANAAKEAAQQAAEAANAAGITSVQASMEDNEPGTPSVDVSLLNKVLTLVFHYLKGAKGDTGATPAITIGTVTTGEPGSNVVVTITGTVDAPVLNFTIPQGIQGPQGNTGSSVDYPFELVDNLTTNDGTKALSAKQGMVLDGKVKELQDAMNGIVEVETDITSLFTTWYDNKYVGANPAKTSTYGQSASTTGDVFKACEYVNISAYAGKKMRIAFLKRSNSQGEQTNLGLCFFSGQSASAVLYGIQFPVASAADTIEPYELEVTIDPTWTHIRTTYAMDEQTYGAFYCKIIDSADKGPLQGQIDTLSASKAKKVDVLEKSDLELLANPARKDGSDSTSGYFAGYKLDLTGAYERGVRGCYFRGSTYNIPGTSTAVIPGYIALADDTIESAISLDGLTPSSNAWHFLPITANSKYLRASYTTDARGGAVWSPEVIYLTTGYDAELQRRLYNLERRTPTGIRVSAATLSDGDSIELTDYPWHNSVGDKVAFGCKVTTMSKVIIGFGYNINYSRWLEIDNTNIVLFGGTDTTNPLATIAHGCTIDTELNVSINVSTTGTALVTLQTLAGYFQHEFTEWGPAVRGKHFVQSDGSTLKNCQLSATNSLFRKDLWIFGASFEGYNTHWVKYAREMGFTSYLLNGFPGRASYNASGQGAYQDLQRALSFGKPMYLFWTIFGNDSSDDTFAEYLGLVNDLCKSLDIIPIYALRPDTPTKDYDARRQAIIDTGARYVDEQKVLQKTLYADGGEWYDGLLSNDGIHPTAAGDKAIAMQVLIDLPEIMQ